MDHLLLTLSEPSAQALLKVRRANPCATPHRSSVPVADKTKDGFFFKRLWRQDLRNTVAGDD